jgi:hypothetical protein
MMCTRPELAGMAVIEGSKALNLMRPQGWNLSPMEPPGRSDPREMSVSPVPNAAGRIRRHDAACFPSASPTSAQRAGKQKTAPKDRLNRMISLRKTGAGEGIRTLDPNLGKVVVTAELEVAERHVFDKGGSTPLDPAGGSAPSGGSGAKPLTLLPRAQPSNGSRTRMVSSRSGLVESRVTGASVSSSMRRTYLTAWAGRSAQERAPRVEACQPSMRS